MKTQKQLNERRLSMINLLELYDKVLIDALDTIKQTSKATQGLIETLERMSDDIK